MQGEDYEVLLVTYAESGVLKLPHLAHLKASNPNTPIHLIVSEDSGYGKVYDWKNSDQAVRKWWLINKNKIQSERVVLIEWDTLVTCKLPKMPQDLDLAGKYHFVQPKEWPEKLQPKRFRDDDWRPENWMWWSEIPKLDLKNGQLAHGLVSFGAYFCRVEVLDSICEARWDGVFGRDIDNELRFPSVVAACGYRIGEIDLPHVEFDEVEYVGKPAIYHSIKKPLVI